MALLQHKSSPPSVNRFPVDRTERSPKMAPTPEARLAPESAGIGLARLGSGRTSVLPARCDVPEPHDCARLCNWCPRVRGLSRPFFCGLVALARIEEAAPAATAPDTPNIDLPPSVVPQVGAEMYCVPWLCTAHATGLADLGMVLHVWDRWIDGGEHLDPVFLGLARFASGGGSVGKAHLRKVGCLFNIPPKQTYR